MWAQHSDPAVLGSTQSAETASAEDASAYAGAWRRNAKLCIGRCVECRMYAPPLGRTPGPMWTTAARSSGRVRWSFAVNPPKMCKKTRFGPIVTGRQRDRWRVWMKVEPMMSALVHPLASLRPSASLQARSQPRHFLSYFHHPPSEHRPNLSFPISQPSFATTSPPRASLANAGLSSFPIRPRR